MLKIKVLHSKLGTEWKLPTYAKKGDVGMDLVAAIDEVVKIAPGQRKLIPTGFCMSLPEGYEAQIRPRSGLALKHGITVLNTPGTIDSMFRGQIGVILLNTDCNEAFEINPGDRIAQMVINKVEIVEIETVSELDQTERGQGGFGHTGI